MILKQVGFSYENAYVCGLGKWLTGSSIHRTIELGVEAYEFNITLAESLRDVNGAVLLKIIE